MQKAGRYFASATYLDLWLGQERREPPRDLLWTLTATAMIATAVGGPLGVPTGLAVGLAVGLVNGLGGCLSAVRSMIFTLGVNAVMRGLMVAHPGGLRAADRGEDLMRLLGAERIMSVPVALLVWAAVSALLNRTTFGKALYLIGNREAAAYLAGIGTRRVVVLAFTLCGLAAALSGVMLAGYATKAIGTGDAYLLPAIDAVVVGVTSILGGRGRYLSTLFGVISIVLVNSALSIMQMSEASRPIIYGTVIIAMPLVYGRADKIAS